MVHVVEESIYGQGYREVNQQLAKENGELRQQLSQALHEICQQRIEIHQKDVEINLLKGQLKDLKKIHERYKAIRDIVDHESVCEEQSSTDKENDLSKLRAINADCCFMDPIEEASELEEQEESENRSTFVTHIHNRSYDESHDETLRENDSLVPPDVTSVPPVDYCERTMQTPSIWNCLDTLGSPSSFPDENHHNKDYFHSTPVQPLKAANKKEPEPEPERKPESEAPPPRYNLRKRAKR